ncbi:MAG: L,D-transpeptidase family protein, partial [Clostridia bacterium]|nr:L,D-transpeptidase family protein [Clostridia bacterium]
LEIAVGESHSLDLPKGEWAVSNPDVAAMDQWGNLTGLAAGKTWLAATIDGELCTIPVTVKSLSEPEDRKEPSGKKAKYRIVVNKARNYVVIYAWKDEELSNPLRAMVCSTGKNTPNGTYSLKSRKVWNRLYGYVWGKYATVITGDFLFHSVPFEEMDSSTLLVEEYNKLGTTASAGCIRMTVEGAKWIYDYCKPGSRVIFTKEDVACPIPVEPAIHVNDKSGWDPTDPDEKNPWHKKSPSLEAADQMVALGESIDLSTIFTAKDSAGNDITDRVEIVGSVDTAVPGIYLLEGTVTDDLGKSAAAHIYLRVVAPKNK